MIDNKWLDLVVKAYLSYFGLTFKPVVWGVGPCDGHDEVELAQRIYKGRSDWFWANANVVCMEPNPDQAKIIEKNYPEVCVIPEAASNKTGTADFIVYEGDEGAVGSSSLVLDWKKDLFGQIITVNTVRLDEILKNDVVDIMKIDVEGHSIEVLEGLGDKIRQIRVLHVETEKWTDSNIKTKVILSNFGFILADETEQYGGMPDQTWVNSLIPRG